MGKISAKSYIENFKDKEWIDKSGLDKLRKECIEREGQVRSIVPLEGIGQLPILCDDNISIENE